MNRSGFRSRRHPFALERSRNEAQTRFSLSLSNGEPSRCYFEDGKETPVTRQREQKDDGSRMILDDGSSGRGRLHYGGGAPHEFTVEKTTGPLETSKVPQSKRRIRPRSYAEPRTVTGRSRLCFSHCGNNGTPVSAASEGRNGILVSRNGTVYSSSRDNDLFTFGNGCRGVTPGGPCHNGVSMGDLETRLTYLRRQQLEKRKSISNFAISCLEPNPTAYFVEEEQQVSSVVLLKFPSSCSLGRREIFKWNSSLIIISSSLLD